MITRFTTFPLIVRLVSVSTPPVSAIGSLGCRLDTLGQCSLVHFPFHQLLNRRKASTVSTVHEGDGCTGGFGSGGPANPLDVIFGIGRLVIVNHQVDAHNVNATVKHIGTH